MKWWKLLEGTRQKTQRMLDHKKSKIERNLNGQHATPFPLALSVLSAALSYVPKSPVDIRMLEPAVGLGVFYSCLLELTDGKMPREALGIEKDYELATLADAIWGDVGLNVRNKDFTSLSPPKEADRFNLVITNPPFTRHHHLGDDKKRLINQVSLRTGIKPSGLMGLYGYFMLLSHDWMKEGGLGVWLIPHEFMDVKYGSALRQYLTEKVELIRIHCFDIEDLQFDDADVSLTVIFFKNKIPTENHEALFTFGASFKKPAKNITIPIKMLRELGKWSAVGQTDSYAIVGRRQKCGQGLRIGDLFNVKRGLATGANSFFIMSRSQARKLKIPKKFLRPILPSSRYLGDIDTIEADDYGKPLVKPTLFILQCALPKVTLSKEYPNLHQYIMEGEKKELHLRHLTRKRQPWYKQEIREPAPILFRYMGRKGKDNKVVKFYRNRSKALVTNSYYMLCPRPAILKQVQDISAFCDRLFKALNNLKQKDIVTLGRSYGGGLYKVEPNELERVYLPRMRCTCLFAKPL